jgi:hypothetical protein
VKDAAVPHRVTWLRSYLWIRQCIGSTLLECGCYTGRYLTYSGRTIDVIDAQGPGCARDDHERDAILDDDDAAGD